MNARSWFSQASIPNRHTTCGPIKKTLVYKTKTKQNKKVFLMHNAQLAIQYSIGPCQTPSTGLQHPSTTAVFSYTKGSRKVSANEQFFVGARTVVSLL